MASFLHPLRLKSFTFLIGVLLLTLTACAGTNAVSNNNGTNGVSNKNGTNSVSNSNDKNSINSSKNKSSLNSSIAITVGGKQDTESQLLSKLYALLLRHAGFNVIEHANSVTNDALFNAVISGNVDLSPAFTSGGLGKLGLNSTGNARLDYLQLKQSYEAKYHLTWLDPAPLNGKVYYSAPVVRDSILKISPRIATILNKLAPILTQQISQQLQSEIGKKGKSVTAVATQFLQSKRLL
ncbi:MAG: hypothetical protein JO011_20340 [Ktedonobacteraceae bacterium]|nr:hypothetical protein [Ktedonobacteraceae bacterium]MBV9713259.1 hypothetical protein [Ktedonobacteraceae bacterium]